MFKYIFLLIVFVVPSCYGMAVIAMGETAFTAVEHTALGKAALNLCGVELQDEAEVVVLDVIKGQLQNLAQEQLDALHAVHKDGVAIAKPGIAAEIEAHIKGMVLNAAAGAVQLKINQVKASQVDTAKKAFQRNLSLIGNGALAIGLVVVPTLVAHFGGPAS